MPKNRVQFQPGLSLAQFVAEFGTEAQCAAALFRWRWPGGFHCPACGYGGYCELTKRKLYQCHRCHHQTSLTSGTLLEGSKLPLRTWFLAMYLLTQSKNGVSALELSRQLGLSYNSAWLLKHKLMQAMKEHDDTRPLGGFIQLDDAYWGGERRGAKRGRGTAGKTPFLAALETTAQGEPKALRLSRVLGFRKVEIERWASKHLQAGAAVLSDGFPSFRSLGQQGYLHRRVIVGPGRPGSVRLDIFNWLNTMLGNVKNALRGTYHALNPKHLPRYLAEFCYRFNRRFRLPAMLGQLARAALRTPPLPYRLAKLAEVHW